MYAGHSNAVLMFGGLDFSGVVCQGGVVRINLGPLTPEVEDEGAWLSPEGAWQEGVGSGGPGDAAVVEVIGVSGGSPAGRYLHTANLIPVSAYMDVIGCST